MIGRISETVPGSSKQDYRLPKTQKDIFLNYINVIREVPGWRCTNDLLEHVYQLQTIGKILLRDIEFERLSQELTLYFAIVLPETSYANNCILVYFCYPIPKTQPIVCIQKTLPLLWDAKVSYLDFVGRKNNVSIPVKPSYLSEQKSFVSLVYKLISLCSDAPPVYWYHVDRIPQNLVTILSNSQLGEGSYGSVYKGSYKISKDCTLEVAVKVPKNTDVKTISKNLKRELETQTLVQHENILRLYGISLTVNALPAIVLALGIGNLSDFIHNYHGSIQNKWKHTWMIQIASAINALHSSMIVHRDLKAENIMLVNNPNPLDKCPVSKVCDFGLAREYDSEINTTFCGSALTMSPEILRKHDYTAKSDVYSFACILYQILTQKDCYFDDETLTGDKTFIQRVIEGHRPTIYSCIPEECRVLLTSCWEVNPDSRPTMKEAYDRLYKMDWKQWSDTRYQN